MTMAQSDVFVFVLFQVFALLTMTPSLRRWSGKSVVWLEGRRFHGWQCFTWLCVSMFWQMLAFGALVEITKLEAFYIFAGVAFFIVGPLLFVFSYIWAPRFVLPRWVRERLAAGDEVRSAYPPIELRHLMSCPQNFPEREWMPRPGLFVLPSVLRVNLVRWWVGGLVATLAPVFMFSWVFGVPLPGIGVFGPEGYLWLKVIMVPLMLVCFVVGLFFLRGAILPEHVELSERGVSTRAWTLEWGEIQEVLAGPFQVVLEVDDPVADRWRRASRWTSGVPYGVGGLQRKDSSIGLSVALRGGMPAAHALVNHFLQEKTGRGESVQARWDMLYGEPFPEGLVDSRGSRDA